SYLYDKVRGRFSFSAADCAISQNGEYETLSFSADETLCPYLRRYTEENIADVIAIGYKYEYFDKRLFLPLLTPKQKKLLCIALVAADFEEDKEYALKRLRHDGQYSIDGVFNFRLGELKRRWEGVLAYIPKQFGTSSLDDFIEFLVEESEGKVYVKEGKVYDEGYHLLSRGKMFSGERMIAEILLQGAAKVYCFGRVEEDLKSFLCKYYKENAFFC
ncbi:MAG: hypothetical protein IJX18_01400, partial [Clostridia bacterium]|nr:hypothetical protein [Clostridia bacterium]